MNRPVSDFAGVKAVLAEAGVSLSPRAQLTSYPRPTGEANVVIVDRVQAGAEPDYCGHGFASCIRCDQLCWLGSETAKLVRDQRAYPLCLQCGYAMRDQLPSEGPVQRVEDHRGASGQDSH